MKIIIAGSRDLEKPENYLDLIEQALYIFGSGGESREIVSGRARGPDTWGEDLAASEEYDVKYFPADWDTHGKAAGYIRNREMAEYADALLLVWDGKSRGSANMLAEARKRGLRVVQIVIEN